METTGASSVSTTTDGDMLNTVATTSIEYGNSTTTDEAFSTVASPFEGMQFYNAVTFDLSRAATIITPIRPNHGNSQYSTEGRILWQLQRL